MSLAKLLDYLITRECSTQVFFSIYYSNNMVDQFIQIQFQAHLGEFLYTQRYEEVKFHMHEFFDAVTQRVTNKGYKGFQQGETIYSSYMYSFPYHGFTLLTIDKCYLKILKFLSKNNEFVNPRKSYQNISHNLQ